MRYRSGEPGFLSYAEVDTAHFLGNFPESTEILGTVHPSPTVPSSDAQWTTLLPRTKLGPGRRHFFPLLAGNSAPFTHVMVKMHPDGGIKRFRVHGRRANLVLAANINPSDLPAVPVPQNIQDPLPSATSDPFAPVSTTSLASPPSSMGIILHGQLLPAVPLTSEAFAPYGAVIDGPSPVNPGGKAFKVVNQGTAKKYLDLAQILNNYPAEAGARTNVHVYRCEPASQLPFEVKLLERHRFTTQAFIPMVSVGGRQEGFLVVVALNSKGTHHPILSGSRCLAETILTQHILLFDGDDTDDKPDLSTLAVFSATTEQAIQYHPGVWHHPMIALGGAPTDFACIVNESASQPQLDCDEVEV